MLSPAERAAAEIDMIMAGYNNAEIGQQLGIRERTVKMDCQRLYREHSISQQHRLKKVALAVKMYTPSEQQPTQVQLTKRQMEAARLAAMAYTRQMIGEKMGTTAGAVNNLLREMYEKIGVNNRIELALWYRSHHGDPEKQ